MALIQYEFGIPSMRCTIKEIENNVTYLWFLVFGSWSGREDYTFRKNYVRRFQDTDVFKSIFYRVLAQGVETRFVDPSVLFIDSTHIKANANKRKYKKKFVRRAAQQYKEELDSRSQRGPNTTSKSHLSLSLARSDGWSEAF